MKTLHGYHFVGETLRDGRLVPKDGVWLKHEGEVEPCESGLHMSEHPFDALKYAPGETLCLVELRGDLQPHGIPIDKWVGRERRILERIDATHLLRRFAADQALSVKHLWDMPPIVEQYLTTLDEGLREEAEVAARAAVRVAARAAARTAGAAAWNATVHVAVWAARNTWSTAWEAWEARESREIPKVRRETRRSVAEKITRAGFKWRVERAFGL